MTVPPKYGVQTLIGAAVILTGLGFVGAQLLAPPASTANSTQPVAARPAPRIIEINTKREDAKREEFAREDIKQATPEKPIEQAAAPGAPPAPQTADQGPPPVSAAELKQKAQTEAPPIVDETNLDNPLPVVSEPRRSRSHSRQRYPRYDRHAVY